MMLSSFFVSILRSGVIVKIFSSFFTYFKGFGLRITDQFFLKKEGVPMTFSSSENDGWGVCTLRAKRKFGKTAFVQYDFDLPKSNLVLPLKLGQQCELCCLDNKGNVAKGDFFVYHPSLKPTLGKFSVIAPNKSSMENEYDVGPEVANFVSIPQNYICSCRFAIKSFLNFFPLIFIILI
jgi:hypothetical protein